MFADDTNIGLYYEAESLAKLQIDHLQVGRIFVWTQIQIPDADSYSHF